MGLAYKGKAPTYRSESLTEVERLHRSYNRTADTYHQLHQQVSSQPDITYHDFYMSDKTDKMIVELVTLEVELHNIDADIKVLTK